MNRPFPPVEPRIVSIIVPTYNERENLQRFHSALCEVLWREPYAFEILFVDDGSSDGSRMLVRGMAQRDPRIRLLTLSRNFGKEVALTAGINHARGEAAILIDADLQHPVELIPQLLRRWERGARMAVGVRQSNQGEGWIKRLGSRAYYRLIAWLSEAETVPRSTDYRLIDRRVIDAFNRFHERNRMTRSLLDWLGFTREYVPFRANARVAGTPGYGTMKLLKLAFASFVSHSLFPLRIAGYLGVAITTVAGVLGVFVFVTKYLGANPFSFSGSAVLAVINVFLTGITLICLGLIALYVASIHDESMARPLYVLDSQDEPADSQPVTGSPPPAPPSRASRSSARRLHFIRHFPPAAYA